MAGHKFLIYSFLPRKNHRKSQRYEITGSLL